MGLNLRNIGKTLDSIIPGDQSFLHGGQAPQPIQQVARVAAPVAQAISNFRPPSLYEIANAGVHSNPITGVTVDAINAINNRQAVDPRFANQVKRTTQAVVNRTQQGTHAFPRVDFQVKTGNPWVDVPSNIGLGIPEAVINAPNEATKAVAGLAQYGSDLFAQGRPNAPTVSQGIGNIAGTTGHAFQAAAPFAAAGSLAKGVGGVQKAPSTATKLLKGGNAAGLGGAEFAGPTAFLQGLQDNKNKKVGDQFKKAVVEGAKSAAMGYAVGFPLGVATTAGGIGVQKAIKAFKPGYINNESGSSDLNAPLGGEKPKVTSKVPLDETLDSSAPGDPSLGLKPDKPTVSRGRVFDDSGKEIKTGDKITQEIRTGKVSAPEDKAELARELKYHEKTGGWPDDHASRQFWGLPDPLPHPFTELEGKTFKDPVSGKPLTFVGTDFGPDNAPKNMIARFQTPDGHIIHNSMDEAQSIFESNPKVKFKPLDLVNNERGSAELNTPAGKPKVAIKTLPPTPDETFWRGVKSGDIQVPPEVKASFDRHQQLVHSGQGQSGEASGLLTQLQDYYHDEQNPQAVYDQAKPVGTEIPKGVTKDKLTPNQQYIKDKSASVGKNPLLGKEYLPDVAPGDLKRALLNGQATSGMVRSRGKLALNAVNNLSDADHTLLDNLRTTPAETLAKQAENPKAFLDAATKVKDYNNFTHISGYNLGQNIGRREQYGAPLLYDMSDKHTAEALNQWRASLPLQPGYTQMRSLPDYAAGEKLGLKRLNQTFGEDLAYDVNRRSSDLSQLSLYQGLRQAYPGQVKVGEIPAGWKQLQIPGGQRLSMPSEIADQINTRAMPVKSTGVLGAYDKGTTVSKNLAVGGGGFHGFTEALRGMGQQALDPQAWMHPIRTAQQDYYAVGGTFSKKIAQQGFDHYQGNGTMDWANLGGTTLGSKELQGDNYSAWYDTLKKGNFIKGTHDAVFQREIPLQKLAIIDRMMQGHTDMTNPDSIARATQASAAANHMFGGLNRQIDGFSPKVAQWLGRGMFSADFTESKVRLLQDALTRGGPQGNIARQAVVGKALVSAAPGVLALAAAGQLDMSNPVELAKAVADQVLDPRYPTGFKDRYGNNKVARLPNNDISEFARVIQPMFDGSADKLSGVKHYAVARVNPLLGLGSKLVTNEDYYGKKMVVKKDGKVDYGKTALNLGSSSATIPGSNLLRTLVPANPNGLKGYSDEQLAGMSSEQKNAILGKISPGEAAVNIAGARVVQDPNSPQSKSFNFQQKVVDNLGQNKPLWEQVFGKKTDEDGNPKMEIGALDSQDKAYTLLTHPQLLDAGQKINDNKRQVGVPSDPFYELPRDKQNVVLNMAVDKFRNPAEKTFIKNQNPWLNDYYANRTAYFNQLNLPASQKTAELPEPKPPDTIKAYSALTDSAQKAQYLGSHPELTDYFTAHDNFIRAGRAKQSLPQYDKYPEAPPQVKQLMDAYASLPKGNGPNGTSPNRSAWIKAHPNEWNTLIAQFSRQAQYGLQQDASQAAYEGQDFSQKGIKDIMSLARDLGMDTSSKGFGRSGFGNNKVALNPYQYAVSLNAGGKVATPRVSSRSGGRSKVARKSTGGKAQVTIKKSLV